MSYYTSCRSHEEGEDEELYVSQEGVHRAVGAEIVNNVLNGVSASCFAYGHTGEGKGKGSRTDPVRSNGEEKRG